jgi:tripartite-type tricarboxylate transporter receptor subunit TctC
MSASRKHVANFSLTPTFATLLLWQAASRLARMIVPFPAGGTADVLHRGRKARRQVAPASDN